MKIKSMDPLKAIAMFGAIAMTLLSYSCAENDEPQAAPNTTSDSDFEALNTQFLETLNAQFPFDFFKEVEKSESKENFIISPLSLSIALGMTYNGAGGETREAFGRVLHYNDLSATDINLSNKKLIDILSTQGLQLANSIWISDDFTVKDEFIRLNKENYGAMVSRLNFSDPQSITAINDWVSQKTSDKIPEIIREIHPDEVMFLINAIYFNEKWLYKFDVENNRQIEFHATKDNHVTVEAMSARVPVLFTENERFSSVMLPYEGNIYSMVLLLPKPDKSVRDIAVSLTSARWKDYLGTYKQDTVSITIPKFKMEYKNQLNDELISLGLGVAFGMGGQADFSGISDTPLKISTVIQKAFITVNEEGTEAAATTLVGIVTLSAFPPQKTFYLNRPFVFLIKENKTETICFMGKVSRPE